jgi:arylsulfatase A-like enzyme
VRGDIDWLWLAETAGAPAPAVIPRSMTVNLGRPRRALPAPTARRYSFYLDVPEQASLVFDYGSDKGAQFQVSAEVDGDEPKVIFGPKTAATWTEAQIDLAAYAGKTVRLELMTTGADGVTGWGEPEIMLKTPRAIAARGAAAKNAIIILIDTQRADSFPAFNPKSKVHTPAFDALAKESTTFVNGYVNENWTKPSVATTLTGLYPSTHTTKEDASKVPDKVELLPQRLKKEGFTTAGFIANGYVSDKFGFEKGWDIFVNYIRDNKPSEANYVYRDALAWIQKQKGKRFFTYIQTIDPHVVYRHNREEVKRYFDGEYKGPLGNTITPEEQIAMSEKKGKFSQRDIDWLRALYNGEVTFHDQHMGEFIDALKRENLLNDTLLIITNDHGEELMEHGRAGHGHSLYDELLRAPIVIHYPPMFPPGANPEVIESVDLAPTVVDALGLKPLKDAEGTSLVNLMAGKSVKQPSYAISEFLNGQRSVRVGRWKFIRTPGDRSHLFDVVKDPGETVDYIKKENGHKQNARRLAEVHLGEGLAVPDKSKRLDDAGTRQRFTAGCADIDPETRRQLEALGYFGGTSTPCK